MFEYIDIVFPKQKKELPTGNREYKIFLDLEKETKTDIRKTRKLSKPQLHYMRKEKLERKINKRASQLQYRLEEGKGRALYIIGVKDDGTPEGITIDLLFTSLDFLFKMVSIVNARIINIRIYKGHEPGKYIFTARIDIPDYIPHGLLSI